MNLFSFIFPLFILLEDNCFTLLCWPLPYINMNQPQVYICPLLPESPSHLLHYPSPLILSQSSGLSSHCHTANSHLLSIIHMIMYIFPCYSLRSSQSLLPPLCSQVCSLCLRLHWVLFLKLFVLREKIEPIDIVYQYVPSTLLDIYNMTSVNPPYHL